MGGVISVAVMLCGCFCCRSKRKRTSENRRKRKPSRDVEEGPEEEDEEDEKGFSRISEPGPREPVMINMSMNDSKRFSQMSAGSVGKAPSFVDLQDEDSDVAPGTPKAPAEMSRSSQMRTKEFRRP